MPEIIVFQAKKIITMNPSQPIAKAIAMRDGRIVEVSSLERLKPWLDAHPHTIDDSTFRDKVLMPGFNDPHLHPDIAVGIENLKDIRVWGTIFEGEVHPVQK